MFEDNYNQIRNTNVKLMRLAELGFLERARQIINRRETKRIKQELGID